MILCVVSNIDYVQRVLRSHADGIPTATVLPYQEMVMEDQIAAESFELNLTDDQLEEMEDIILELITVSKRYA